MDLMASLYDKTGHTFKYRMSLLLKKDFPRAGKPTWT